jgi:hypothetical protein
VKSVFKVLFSSLSGSPENPGATEAEQAFQTASELRAMRGTGRSD